MSSLGRFARMIAGGILLSGVLVSCGRGPTEVAVGGSSSTPRTPAPPAPTTSFQGAVASVDRHTGIMVVDVQIVWTPVIKGGAHERRVLVDAQTEWEPARPELGDRLVGGEVQVEAVDAVEGVWPAVKVQLLDID